MIIDVTLTDTVKTETRDAQNILLESLLEKKNKEEKEPRNQLNPINKTIDIVYGNIYSEKLTINDLPLFPLKLDGTGFLIQENGDIDLPPPNYLNLWYSTNSTDWRLLGFDSLDNVRLHANIQFYRRSNVPSFGSNFSFSYYLVIAQVTNPNPETVVATDYQPFVQLNLGTVNYNSATNTFSPINYNQFIDISALSQYNNLITGNLKISCYFGVIASSLTVPQKQFLANRPFVLLGQIQLDYAGTNTITKTIINT